MTERNKTARIAGLLYLILVISGIINLMYIPSQLIVWESPSETLDNIINFEFLFRLGIVSGIVTFLTFLLLPLALYRLLHEVNKTSAMLMVIFAFVSIPISFINILSKFSILTLLEKADYLSQTELQNQVMMYLYQYNNGIYISQIFWGLWLLPFGFLVYHSGFLPKLLGVLLMAGCFGYLISFFGNFLIEDFNNSLLADLAGIPASIGEIGICLWLLIMGTNTLFGKKTH